MTNLILMAAARGARVQAALAIQTTCMCVICGQTNKFSTEERMALTDSMRLAIHPDDEHLRFGPVSSALREYAERALRNETLTLPVGLGAWWLNTFDYREYSDCESNLHRSLFLLLLSEALAEDGL